MRGAKIVFIYLATISLVQAAEAPSFDTPVKAGNFDAAAYAEWVDGAERALVPKDARDSEKAAQWVVWTEKTTPGHSGLAFGASKNPGVRHLRVGFKEPIAVGAVLVRGGVQVSVLKSDAAYPGNLNDDSQWVPAERIKKGAILRAEGTRENYLLWTLPQNVATRALRFTHTADVTDKDYAGWIGGAYVLLARVANVATQASVAVSSNERNGGKINNELVDPGWEQWANIPINSGERANVISAANPEWAMMMWNAPVTLRGVGVCFAGFGEAEVQAFDGPADVHPREAPESAWKTVRNFSGLKNRYPISLPVDWLDFGKDITTRALRVRMIAPMPPAGHPHVQGHTRDGKRMWLGELLALMPLNASKIETAILPRAAEKEKPPIAVKFTLPEAGFVTLVIEDASGKRVRNLIADTFFEKGENTAWWDGSDDLGRDPSAAKHGLYYIPTQFVAPGTYRVRGLWRKQVDVKYELGVYSAGSVPWETGDRTGGWLSNHTPPSSVLFVPNAPDGEKTRPAILIGSYVSEGTAGLAWVDLDGKKWKGQNWVGGTWTGAPYLARDAGPKALPGIYAYAAAAWSVGDNKSKQGEIRVTALTAGADKSIIKYPFTPTMNASGGVKWEEQIGGLAVYDGVVAFSMPTLNKVVLVDAATGKVKEEREQSGMRGLAYDKKGNRYLVITDSVYRLSPNDAFEIPFAQAREFDDTLDRIGICIDQTGNVYVSSRGQNHVIEVYGPGGHRPTRIIGHPGAPKAGPYDPLHMNNPRGMTIDSNGNLWVAEEDYQPKRVSVWKPDGTLLKAFYGPAEYGGGGSVDPRDKTKFYYNGMEFKIDWQKGTSEVASVFYRPDEKSLKLAERCGVPQNAIYANGRRYFTNAYNSNPTGGHGSAFIFADRDGVAVPCAAAGRANEWDVLKTAELKAVWPKDTDPKANPHTQNAAFFIWSDLNADGQVQPNEVTLIKATNGGVTVQRDLSIVVARLNGKAVGFKPKSFTAQGVPQYDLKAMEIIVAEANVPPSSGGDQAMVGADGWSFHTNAPKPYSADAIGGAKNGVPMWSYPSLWPGLHASHEAPVPDRAGEIIGHTRLLGDSVTPKNGEPLWFLNENTGPIAIFTNDGLLVTQLFQDMRLGRPWAMPAAQRGMVLNELTPSDENFWPNVSQTDNGEILLVTGRPNCIARVEGLETIKRIAAFDLTIGADDLNRAREYFARAEAARQAAQGHGVLTVAMRKDAPVVDGKLDDWADAAWVEIDKRGSAAYFNSNSKPYDVTGAVAVSGEKLYAAWRTGDKDLLRNAGDAPNALFKTGGALDLMIGANANADPKRGAPMDGDVRLLVTVVGGKTRALLYRAVAPGEKEKVAFSSPWRTINFDRVEDVSEQVQLAGMDGNFEIAVPLSVIGLKPASGMTIRGDIGILRGTGSVTTQRAYWSNKATAIVADVPSEAELQPRLWGRWEFK